MRIDFIRKIADFNPRSYKRSDQVSFEKYTNEIISIHAPTRGATIGG